MQQVLLNLVAWEYNWAGFEGRTCGEIGPFRACENRWRSTQPRHSLLGAIVRKQLSLLVSVVAGFGGLGVQLVEFRQALQHTDVVTSGQALMARSMEAMRCLAILCLVVSFARIVEEVRNLGSLCLVPQYESNSVYLLQ